MSGNFTRAGWLSRLSFGAIVAAATTATYGNLYAQDDAATSDGEAKSKLTIGSPAPEINIEHWFQEGEKKQPAITSFESGKVYVVEFWATWCPPCIASMPHLAEVQEKYRDKGVRIISVSDEDTDTVKEFLAGNVKDGGDKTYQQLTNAYSLTTDPDQSVFNDYMVAAGQNGIPTAFIVGKTSQIEWIGHPMEMDEPLQGVVEDKWDRAAFAKRLADAQAQEALMQKAIGMLRQQDMEGAIKLLGDSMDKASEAMSIMQLSSVLYQVSLQAELPETLVTTIIAKLEMVANSDNKNLTPFCYDLQARFLQGQGKIAEAIAAETKAIAIAPEQMKSRMSSFLDELKEQLNEKENTGDSKDK